ncbi:MAG: fibronectin type III domain-containing protein [Patescibacteria group bacterium]
MLVQKSGLSKRSKILLIIFCALMLPAGYFVYSSYLAPPPDPAPVVDTGQTASEQPVIVTPLNESLLRDAQGRSFTEKSVDEFADQQSGIYLDPAVPLAPERVTVANPKTGGKLLVSWQLPAQPNFTKVKLYRAESAGTVGEEIYSADVKPTDILMNYVDQGLINQKTYYYLVITVNSTDSTSANNQQYSGTPSDVFPPSAPMNVTVKNLTDNQVKISWVVPPDPDFSAVRIYKSSQRGILGALIWADVQPDAGNGQFALDAVTPNTPYYYTVTSLDTAGNESSTNVLAAPYRANPFEPSS